MSKEVQMILEMIKEKKITVDEGAKLIDALEEEKAGNKSTSFEKSFEILNELPGIINKSIEKGMNSGVFRKFANFGMKPDVHKKTMEISRELQGKKLNLYTEYGNVKIKGIDSKEAKLKFDINKCECDEDEVIVDFDEDGIRAETKDGDEIEVYNIEAQVPFDTSLKVECDAGGILVEDIDGADEIELYSDAGNIAVYRIKNTENIKAETDAGNIDAENLDIAEEISLHTDAGEVKISSVKSSEIELYTDAGNIKIKDTDCGYIKAETDAGNIVLENVKYNDSDFDTECGKIVKN